MNFLLLIHHLPSLMSLKSLSMCKQHTIHTDDQSQNQVASFLSESYVTTCPLLFVGMFFSTLFRLSRWLLLMEGIVLLFTSLIGGHSLFVSSRPIHRRSCYSPRCYSLPMALMLLITDLSSATMCFWKQRSGPRLVFVVIGYKLRMRHIIFKTQRTVNIAT